jgi:hypothetical protein
VSVAAPLWSAATMNFASIDRGLFGLLDAAVGLFVLMLVLLFVGVLSFRFAPASQILHVV